MLKHVNGGYYKTTYFIPQTGELRYTIFNTKESYLGINVLKGNYQTKTDSLSSFNPSIDNTLVGKTFNEILEDYIKDSLIAKNTFIEEVWQHSTRNIRLTVTKEFITECLVEGNELATIIIRLQEENKLATDKFIFFNSYETYIYLNEILSDNIDIVTPYIQNGSIIVETL